MISIDYAAQNMRGVWRMAFGGDWREDLDLTTEGVFKSFWAIALSAPLALLAFAAARRAVLDTPEFQSTIFAKAPFSVLLLAELGALTLYWVASITALVMITKAIDASRHIASLIIAFNWGQLLTFIIIAGPAALLGLTGDASLFVLFYLPALFISLAILWGVLRKNLPVTISMTIALIAMITLIEIIINTLVTHGVVELYLLLS